MEGIARDTADLAGWHEGDKGNGERESYRHATQSTAKKIKKLAWSPEMDTKIMPSTPAAIRGRK